MKGKIWNGRGLRDLAKHLHIADCVKEHDLDFVAISETGRRDFPMHTLNHLSGGIEFIWKWIPPRGRSGGILIGVRDSSFELLDDSFGEFHIKLHLRNKSDNFICSPINSDKAPYEIIRFIA